MTRLPLPLLSALVVALLVGLAAVSGCSASDPDLAGAQERLRHGDYQEALALADRAIANDPTNAQAFLVRGEIYRHMAQEATGAERVELTEQMMQSYRQARELDPTDQLLELTLMQAYGQEMNRGAQAWEAATDDPNQFLEAAAAFESAAVIQPDSAAPYMYQGLALLAAGETAAAAEPLQAAVDRDIDAVEAYHYLAQIYLVEDRADEAITVLEEAVGRFPDEVELRTELLNIYAHTGQIERALTAYEQMVVEHPDDPVLRYNYGSFLLQARDYDAAAEQLQVAIELDPQSADAFYNLGAAYLNQAIALHEDWTELDPMDAEAIQLLTRRDALLQQAVPPLERARELFDRQENIEDACRGLFRAYALLGQDAKAREAAQCAGIELD